MTAWSEIDQIRKDPIGAKLLAARLLRYSSEGLTEWESDFLDDLQARSDTAELSTRQAEKLVQIRDAVERVSAWRGFSIATLIRRCHEARADLNEADEAWIVELHAAREDRLRRRWVARLIRCARELQLIDGHLAA